MWVKYVVSALDDERIEDYLKFREQIAHDRVDKYFKDQKKKDAEGQRVYTRPTSQTYHLIKERGGEASNYGKVYDAKTGLGLPSNVILTEKKKRNQGISIQTDEIGNFILPLPVDGEYAVNVNRKGYLFY